jgi:plastocyanin
VLANSGDTGVFRNSDASMHHIVMDDGSSDLGDVGPGATSRGFTLRNANATKFHCTIHPSMVGSINDTVAPEPVPCPDPYGYGC